MQSFDYIRAEAERAKGPQLDDGPTADVQEDYVHKAKPLSDLSWSILSSPNATSRIHCDTQGLSTASLILNEEGGKYWVVARPKKGVNDIGPEYVAAYHKFSDDEAHPCYDWEGVLLTENCLL